MGGARRLCCPTAEHTPKKNRFCCAKEETVMPRHDEIANVNVFSSGAHLSSFSPSIFIKYRAIVVWSRFSSSATSLLYFLGLASTIALNWSLSTSDTRPPHLSRSSRLKSPARNFSNHLRVVCSEVVSSPHALMTFRVVFAALWPSLNS